MENDKGDVMRRRGSRRRMETALDVIGQFEVETLLLYTTEDVTHRFRGPRPFSGSGTGPEVLRRTMVGILGTYSAGFQPREMVRHIASDFGVLEWSCVGRTTTDVETVEGIFLVRFHRDRITDIRGCFYLSSQAERSEDGQGQEVDEDCDDDGDEEEEYD
jgi:hypothetical protein